MKTSFAKLYIVSTGGNPCYVQTMPIRIGKLSHLDELSPPVMLDAYAYIPKHNHWSVEIYCYSNADLDGSS